MEISLVSYACCRTCAPELCRYFDPETVGLDFEGMIQDIEAAPNGSIILLHGQRRCLGCLLDARDLDKTMLSCQGTFDELRCAKRSVCCTTVVTSEQRDLLNCYT